MKKINKVKSNKSLFLAAIIVVLIVFGVLISQSRSEKTKAFQSSEVMDFSISVPADFEVSERFGSVTVDADKKGKIAINRNGTQFKDLGSYIANFDSMRKLTSSDTKKFTVDGHDTLARTVKFPDQNYSQRSYYLYIDNVVYIFSTSSEELYDELDQIAKSFKYTGE